MLKIYRNIKCSFIFELNFLIKHGGYENIPDDNVFFRFWMTNFSKSLIFRKNFVSCIKKWYLKMFVLQFDKGYIHRFSMSFKYLTIGLALLHL